MSTIGNEDAVHPDDAWNARFCFDHASRGDCDDESVSEWFWALLCARHASVFRTHEQEIYLDMEWDGLSTATRSGIVFG